MSTDPSAAAAVGAAGPLPGAPHRLADLGVPSALLLDLALRRALYDGETSTVALADRLALSLVAAEGLIGELRRLRYVEVLGLERNDYRLGLTDLGRTAATERLALCRYADAAPVGLDQYLQVVRAQDTRATITPDTMSAALSDLVVADSLRDSLGPSLVNDGAIFLYGPPGTGKTSLAERLVRVHHDRVLVPRAVEVDGHIVTVFDPVVHRPVEPTPPDLDPRWVLCERPSIITGGELTAEMLDLTFEAGNGVYLAPLQMQANNGILVIDDFGRQVLTPEQLLNRWIVPLSRRVDYLSLSYGVKFEVPFAVKVVFSTNLDPAMLGDQAFFRRIRNKVLVPSISDEEFDEVLRRVAGARGVPVAPGAAAHLREVSRTWGDGDLRPYLPGEVVHILSAISDYEHRPLVIDAEGIDRFAELFFTHERATSGSATRPRDDRAGPAIPRVRAPEPATSRVLHPPPGPRPVPPPVASRSAGGPRVGPPVSVPPPEPFPGGADG